MRDSEPSAPLLPSASSAPRPGMLTMCRTVLFALSVLIALSLLLLHVTSTATTTSDADAASHSALHHWLQLHPPRQVSHDAELLRRRRLGAMIEFSPAQLAEHVPAIIASLDHTDGHIRRLAMGMIDRLEPAAVCAHANALAAHLRHTDVEVRLHVLQALARPGADSAAALAPHASAIVVALEDDDSAVRWAAVDALALLDPSLLAPHALAAVNALLQREDLSLAQAAAMSWSPRLENYTEVLTSLGKLSMHANGFDRMGGGTSMGQPQTWE